MYGYQYLYHDKKNNHYFLEQDITVQEPPMLRYNAGGTVFWTNEDSVEEINQLILNTQHANKYGPFELKIFERSYPGLGFRLFKAQLALKNINLDEDGVKTRFEQDILNANVNC